MKRTIVVSGINWTEGGSLKIFEDCLRNLTEYFSKDFEIYAILAYPNLINIEGVNYLTYPDAKKSYFHKFYYEFIYFKKLSVKLKPFLWLSLSNINPNVKADIVASYYHNVCPFFKIPFIKYLRYEPKIILFHLTYKFLFKFNHSINSLIIVQSKWMKNELKKFLDFKNIIIAYLFSEEPLSKPQNFSRDKRIKRFFFPALPRVFKNFEVLCEASKILAKEFNEEFEVVLTISGNDTPYDKMIYKKYSNILQIKFIGILTSEQIRQYYHESDVLIFPSKMESWGLPISEFKHYKKPIFIVDLPYAHETVGNYTLVKYFDPHNSIQLATLMKKFINSELSYDENVPKKKTGEDEEIFTRWKELLKFILSRK